jgi:glutamate-1-semialdehyde 2,1-aminomutase
VAASALLNRTLEGAIAAAEERYVAANPESRRRFEAATEALPGGNTRTVLHYDPFPLTLRKGAGARLWDVDGHEYVDFVCEQTAALYGHSNPVILAAARRALEDGLVLGGPNIYEHALADEIKRRFPSLDLLRFCNSGTEANLLALATARAATKREKILVFEGGYHGGVLSFSKGAGPINAPFPIVVATYNDSAGAAAAIEREAANLAAVILEPVMGGAGCIPADAEFLAALRAACTKHGVILVFDEVMTSRLSPGGRQGMVGIAPDLTTLGKYLGGGFTFGAFGGRRDLMQRYDPRRPDHVAHAGTFNNAVCTMAAGLAGLCEVLTPEASRRLNDNGDRLRRRLAAIAAKRGLPIQVTGTGSMMCLHFRAPPIRNAADAAAGSAPFKKLLQLEMLLGGFYFSRRGMVVLALPHEDTELAALAGAFEAFLDKHGDLIAA